MKNEIWIPIKGYEKNYAISNFGRVKRLCGVDKRVVAGMILAQKVRRGYWVVHLNQNNSKKIIYVHRLIAIAFIPNTQNKPHINHIDGDKQNNSIDNLEWCTNRENLIHAIRIGLKKPMPSAKSPFAKFGNETALAIFNDNGTHIELAKKYKVCPATIGFIKTGMSWSSVTGKVYKRKRK